MQELAATAYDDVEETDRDTAGVCSCETGTDDARARAGEKQAKAKVVVVVVANATVQFSIVGGPGARAGAFTVQENVWKLWAQPRKRRPRPY